MKIILSSDHAGFKLKSSIKNYIEKKHPDFKILDFGSHSEESSDYPVFASKGSQALEKNEGDRAIFICGSGIGISIAASKVANVLSPLIKTKDQVVKWRKISNGKSISLGQTLLSEKEALEIVELFLITFYDI